ncbi:MAG: radical SAM protein, partial [Gammaproteobacteria bacterium]
DIPFQHASRRILKLMKRPAHAEAVLERIAAWRAICPDITIRSTFIVGFPGETEAEFDELLDFLDEAELDRVGCFTYSPVDGAPANDLPGQVPDEVKQARWQELMAFQAEISAEKLQRRIGREIEVLVDRIEDGVAIARSAADAPDIDGVVRVPAAADARPGELLRVRVTGADDYDLQAQRST